MRITHLERLQQILLEKNQDLISIFTQIEKFDLNPITPINEEIIDRFFTAEECANIFGYTAEKRAIRTQRKMDMAVTKQTYHLWKDQKYFDISPHLVEKLKKTSIKDIDTYFLRVPYRSMYINLPKGNGLYISNKEILHEVNAIYLLVQDNKIPQNIKIKRKDMIIEDVTKHISVMFWGEEKGIHGDTIMFSDLLFKEGKISKSLDLNIEILENPNIMSELLELFNFIVKLVLYINCSNASLKRIMGINLEDRLSKIKNSGKRRKFINRYSKESLKSHDYIDITIDHSNYTKNMYNNPDSTNKKTKALEYVRPHFKVQNYGSMNSKSKIIWVDPYIRGEGSENLKKRIYKVR